MAATTERIILDPSEVATSRTALDITPWIDFEGIDWGEAAIDTFMAQRERGEIPVDYTVPNREITAPLQFPGSIGGTTPITARANVQAKIALFQKEGGYLKRLTQSGGTVYADVVDATMSATSVSGWESGAGIDLEATISLTALPDFYEAERTLSDHTETTAAELVFTETSIVGDYPARVRIVVDDDQAVDQKGLIWGFRSRHYSAASTAALKYEAEALTALDTATKPALTGASGGTVVTHGTLSAGWTPVMSTNLSAGTYLTHTGSYRLWGRVYSTSGTTVQTRAVWDVGDLVNPVENDAVRLPGATNFFMVDYGEVRLDPAPVGTHRWQGQIHARGDAGAENFSVDKLWLQPLDEGAGKLTAPLNTVQGVTTFSARSEFNTESGAINGDAAAVGGNWASSGDATDVSVGSGVATRVEVSDADQYTGRYVASGVSAMTSQVVQADLKWSTGLAADGIMSSGVLARFGATSADCVTARLTTVRIGSASSTQLNLDKRASSVTTNLWTSAAFSSFAINSYYTIRVGIFANGYWFLDWGLQGAASRVASGQDDAFATGGSLASGKPGFYDSNTATTAVTRTYDNFSAWAPVADAVMFASQSAQLTTDGIFREDSTGASYGPVSVQTGDLPRLPVAGLESRTTEVLIKGSRGDLNLLSDPHTSTDYGDNISAQVFYRPCWLHVPST